MNTGLSIIKNLFPVDFREADITEIIKRFIDVSKFPNLTKRERELYNVALAGEIIKTMTPTGRTTTEQLKKIKSFLPKNNWGLMVFKPPRASSSYSEYLEEKLYEYFRKYGMVYVDKYRIEKLTRNMVSAMYPMDREVNYWQDLETQLIGSPAIYFLFESRETDLDIGPRIELIRGWYKVDRSRNRNSPGQGLRGLFRNAVISREGISPEKPQGSPLYEDTGVHAPCSITSRFLQLLTFMAIDTNGARWVRSCFPWLSRNSPAR